VDAAEYKNYIFTFMFYRFLSEQKEPIVYQIKPENS